MAAKLITEEFAGMYPIHPSHIDAVGRDLTSVFEDLESNKTASRIICHCFNKGSWHPFSLQSLTEYYDKRQLGQPDLGWLVENDLIDVRDGVVTVSHEFVARCYLAAPIFDRKPVIINV